MFKVLLPEVFLEAESTLPKNLKASSTQLTETSPLAEDDKRLNNPFVDVLSISKVFPILHDGVFPEPKQKQAHTSSSILF